MQFNILYYVHCTFIFKIVIKRERLQLNNVEY